MWCEYPFSTLLNLPVSPPATTGLGHEQPISARPVDTRLWIESHLPTPGKKRLSNRSSIHSLERDPIRPKHNRHW